MARELGVTRMAMPTNGNAGAALAAYAARAGIAAWGFCPDDTPLINVTETAYLGARTNRRASRPVWPARQERRLATFEFVTFATRLRAVIASTAD